MVHSVRGTQDLYGYEAKLYKEIVSVTMDMADRFGLEYIELPKIEYRDLFLRGIGEQTDIVSKELFHWEDRAGRVLCLRPEGTAQTVRFLLERGQSRERLQRYLYIGSMFRAERPQKGRLREFHQIGVEIFAESSFLADIEVIHFAWLLLQRLNIPEPVLRLNSLGCDKCRPKYIERLKLYLSSHIHELSEISRGRLDKNPLRILDSKEHKDQEILNNAPSIAEDLCSECREHFLGVQNGLAALDIPFILDTRLVRGLDYYTRTAFEISLPFLLGSQDAVCGGGRYDGLVNTISGKQDTPAVGLAIGIERLMIALDSMQKESKIQNSPVEIIVISEETLLPKILPFVSQWRKMGRNLLIDVDNRALGKKIAQANKLGVPFVVIFGSQESEVEVFAVKDLKTSNQKQMNYDEISVWMRDFGNFVT